MTTTKQKVAASVISLVILAAVVVMGTILLVKPEARAGYSTFDQLRVNHAADFDSTVNIDGVLTQVGQLNITDDLKVGDGTPDTTLNGEDGYIEGTFEVDGATNFDGNMQIDGTVTVGVAGTGLDVQFFSDTSGDHFLWDQSEEALTIIGTNAADALNIDDGNVDIADDIDVDGTTNVDVLDVDDTANFAGAITGPAINIENVRLPTIVSSAIVSDANDGALFTITDGEIWIIHGVWINVTTNFDCDADCTLILGDGTDTDGLCVLADAELQAADTEYTGAAAGWQCMAAATRGVYLDEVTTNAGPWGHVYAPSGTDETIDVNVGGTNLAAGGATVYLMYTRLQ